MDKEILQVIEIAKHYNIDKLVLFGSQAKATANKYSDYDILVYGDNYTDFALEIEYNYISLKSFDLHNASSVSKDFLKEIIRTGKIIYEKAK